MAQLLYWCVYKFDLGPLGPTTLNLALRAWQKQSRRRLHFEPFFGRCSRGTQNRPRQDVRSGSVRLRSSF